MITKEIIKELEKEFPKNLAEEWGQCRITSWR